jgi:hypothetical protein
MPTAVAGTSRMVPADLPDGQASRRALTIQSGHAARCAVAYSDGMTDESLRVFTGSAESARAHGI